MSLDASPPSASNTTKAKVFGAAIGTAIALTAAIGVVTLHGATPGAIKLAAYMLAPVPIVSWKWGEEIWNSRATTAAAMVALLLALIAPIFG